MQNLTIFSRLNSRRIGAKAAFALGCLSLISQPIAAHADDAPVAQTLPTTAAIPEVVNPLGLAIHHVTLGVADIKKQTNFYHDILGFRIGLFRVRPQFDHQQMDIPGFRLDMIAQKDSVRPAQTMSNDKQGWLHIDFVTTDADALFYRLQAKGVPVAPGRKEGDKIASFKVTDPEGNIIEITN